MIVPGYAGSSRWSSHSMQELLLANLWKITNTERRMHETYLPSITYMSIYVHEVFNEDRSKGRRARHSCNVSKLECFERSVTLRACSYRRGAVTVSPTYYFCDSPDRSHVNNSPWHPFMRSRVRPFPDDSLFHRLEHPRIKPDASYEHACHGMMICLGE